jgi:hypothetical protein
VKLTAHVELGTYYEVSSRRHRCNNRAYNWLVPVAWRKYAEPATLVIFSTGVAICLLLAYDRPFAAGGVTPTPTAFREINFD